MDIRKVKKLIEMMQESDLGEIEIKEGDDSVRISRASKASNSPIVTSAQQYEVADPSQSAQPSVSGRRLAPRTAKKLVPDSSEHPQRSPDTPTTRPRGSVRSSEWATTPEITGHVTVTAPMVGTFYRAADPDAEPFVTKGQQIKQGDTLCIIESMKMMNRITSEHAGTLDEVLVENATGVEYDQPLFVIKPSS